MPPLTDFLQILHCTSPFSRDAIARTLQSRSVRVPHRLGNNLAAYIVQNEDFSFPFWHLYLTPKISPSTCDLDSQAGKLPTSYSGVRV